MSGLPTTMRPRVFYGLRMTGAVALAMAVSFWLQLEDAYWAPLTAAIVCQPTIGASLRKGQFRIIGTCLGAVAIVVLTAFLPQSRIGLIAGLLVWGMLAGIFSTLLRNTAAYAASLAGYTAVIVFSDAIDAGPGDVFLLAVTRATEISIGVLSAGLVLSATDTGDARARLARQWADLLAGIASGIARTLRDPASDSVADRRALIGTLSALDPLIDEARGETADLRTRPATLQAGVTGTLRALAAWNDLSTHLSAEANHPQPGEATMLDPCLRLLARTDWHDAPAQARDDCRHTARVLLAHPAPDLSLWLLADRTAEALLGLAGGANALALLRDPTRAEDATGHRRLHVPDLFVALVNGLRVGATMLAAALIWIELAWPGGQTLLVFAAVITILFAPQAERATQIVQQFGLGVATSVVLAAVASFAVLPAQQSYLALVLTIGAVMVPAAAMSAGTWNKFFFTAITFIFLALLAPANVQSYDVAGYLNGALGIVGGVLMGLLGFRLIPAVDPGLRTRRLLALALRDVRRLASGRTRPLEDWLGLSNARIAALPAASDPADRARLVASYSAGAHCLRLWRQAPTLDDPRALAPAMQALAAGRVAPAIERLRALAAEQPTDARGLRAGAELVLLSDVLTRHAAHFADPTS